MIKNNNYIFKKKTLLIKWMLKIKTSMNYKKIYRKQLLIMIISLWPKLKKYKSWNIILSRAEINKLMNN